MPDRTAEKSPRPRRRAWSPMEATARPIWSGGRWTSAGSNLHVNWNDKSERTDGTFSREPTSHSILNATLASVPGGQELRKSRRCAFSMLREEVSHDVAICLLRRSTRLRRLHAQTCVNQRGLARKIKSDPPFMKPSRIRPVRSPKPGHAVSCRERKRLRCSLPSANAAYSGWVDIAPPWSKRSQRRVPISRHRQIFQKLAKSSPFLTPHLRHSEVGEL